MRKPGGIVLGHLYFDYDKNKDGVYNDAPAIVPDANHDGRINAIDLKAYGIASDVVAVPFRISDGTPEGQLTLKGTS